MNKILMTTLTLAALAATPLASAHPMTVPLETPAGTYYLYEDDGVTGVWEESNGVAGLQQCEDHTTETPADTFVGGNQAEPDCGHHH